jgi:hypothetical protein
MRYVPGLTVLCPECRTSCTVRVLRRTFTTALALTALIASAMSAAESVAGIAHRQHTRRTVAHAPYYVVRTAALRTAPLRRRQNAPIDLSAWHTLQPAYSRQSKAHGGEDGDERRRTVGVRREPDGASAETIEKHALRARHCRNADDVGDKRDQTGSRRTRPNWYVRA